MQLSKDFVVWEPLVIEKLIVLFFKNTRQVDVDENSNNYDNLMSLTIGKLNEFHFEIAELLMPLIGKPLADNVFGPTSLFLYQLKIANNAFVEMARNKNPNAVIIKKKSIIIRLDKSPDYNHVVVLLHIWRSIYDMFLGVRKINKIAMTQLANAVELFAKANETILEIDHPTDGSVIMFRGNDITLFTNKECTDQYIGINNNHPFKLFAKLNQIANFVSDENEQAPFKKLNEECKICQTPTTMVCGICKNAYYCNDNCQDIDWPIHQKECK